MSFGSVTEQILHGSLDFENHLNGSPAERKRALECISALTSDERECYNSILRNAMNNYNPIKHEPLKIHVSEKLSLFATTSADDPIPQTKDEGKCCLILGIIKIWRIIKDILGYRKSDKKIEKKIHQYFLFVFTNKLQRETLDKFLPYETNPDASTLEQALSQAKGELGDLKELEIPTLLSSSFTLLGANVDMGVDELDAAFARALDGATTIDPVALAKAYQNLYIYLIIRPILFPAAAMIQCFQEAEQGFAFAPSEDPEVLLQRNNYLYAAALLVKSLAPAADPV